MVSVEPLLSKSGTVADRWFVRQVVKDTQCIIKSQETKQCTDDHLSALSNAALYAEIWGLSL